MRSWRVGEVVGWLDSRWLVGDGMDEMRWNGWDGMDGMEWMDVFRFRSLAGWGAHSNIK